MVPPPSRGAVNASSRGSCPAGVEGWGETTVAVVGLVGLGGVAISPEGAEQEVATRTTAPAARTKRVARGHHRRAARSCAGDTMVNGSNLVELDRLRSRQGLVAERQPL